MIMELRGKSQITIPKELVVSLGLKEGDKLDITEKNGALQIIPVAVYPQKYVDALKDELTQIKEAVKKGEQPVFNSLDDLFKKLDN